jgi:hypothetical protein
MASLSLEKILFQTKIKKRKTYFRLELTEMPYFAKHTTYSSGHIKVFFKNKKLKIPIKYA